jgi:hypothetical protein
MSEGEETKWRLGTEPEEAEEKAAELSSEEDEKKEELRETVQTNVEEIGGGGEGSLITQPEEVPITEAPKKKERITKTRRLAKKKESDSSENMAKISKELERQTNQLARIEKAVMPLQKSINKIDKKSNTVKQLHTKITQLQRKIYSTRNIKQIQGTKKKKKGSS